VPAVLAAPLLARLFQGRATSAAYLAVAALTIGLTIAHAQTKPLTNPYGYGRPWGLTQVEALNTNSRPEIAASLAELDKLVPADACVGAALDVWEPSYLIFGPKLRRHVTYLPLGDAASAARDRGLSYVVVGSGLDRSVPDGFTAAGWQVTPLPGWWLLASDPRAEDDTCPA
jgi:hypothetical protein